MSEAKNVRRVRPDKAVDGFETSSYFLGRGTPGVVYPVKLDNHALRVEYVFKETMMGWKRIGIKYLCQRCQRFLEYTDDDFQDYHPLIIRLLRMYMVGYVIDEPCALQTTS